jgi:hypothetical protein
MVKNDALVEAIRVYEGAERSLKEFESAHKERQNRREALLLGFTELLIDKYGKVLLALAETIGVTWRISEICGILARRGALTLFSDLKPWFASAVVPTDLDELAVDFRIDLSKRTGALSYTVYLRQKATLPDFFKVAVRACVKARAQELAKKINSPIGFRESTISSDS